MARKPMPSLRYYARFRGEFGKLRVVVRYKEKRCFITTPYVIKRSQLSKLESDGHFTPNQYDDSDMILWGRLREYTALVWKVVNPIVEAGEFANITSEELQTAIQAAQDAKHLAFIKKLYFERGINPNTLPQEAFAPGMHHEDGRLMTRVEKKQFLEQFKHGKWSTYAERQAEKGKEGDK